MSENTERDELARIFTKAADDDGLYIGHLTAEYAADMVIDAGYRKPRTITTVEELYALPDMSTVLDDMDGPLTRFDSSWRAADGAQFHSLDVVLPATVLYEATL